MAQFNRLFAQRGALSRPSPQAGVSGADALNRGLSAVSGGLADLQKRSDAMAKQRDDFWVTREVQRFDRDMSLGLTEAQDNADESGAGLSGAANSLYAARLENSLSTAPTAAARDMFRRAMETAKPDFDEAVFKVERGMARDYTVSAITETLDDYSQVARREGQAGYNPSFAEMPDRIAQAESGGSATARNPNSSATGKFQFIRSTWLENVKKHRPDVAGGKSDDEIWALATDEGLQDEIEGHFRASNIKVLASNGHEADAGNVYLAHFMGASGALKALSASPDAPISKVMGRKAIEANAEVSFNGKDFKDFTAGDLVDWSRAKMGDEVSAQKDLNGVPVWNGPIASPDTNGAVGMALADLDELLAVMPGTKAEKAKLKRVGKAQVTKAWLSGLAEKSPSQAMAALRSGKYDREITLADDRAIEGIATSAHDEFERQIANEQKKIDAARKEQQALNASMLSVRTKSGDAGAAEWDAAFAGGEVNHRAWATGRNGALAQSKANRAEAKTLRNEAYASNEARLKIGMVAGSVGTDQILTALEGDQISLSDAAGLLGSAKSESESLSKKQRDRRGAVIQTALYRQALQGEADEEEVAGYVEDGFVSGSEARAILSKNDSALEAGSGKEEVARVADAAVAASVGNRIPANYDLKANRDAADRSFVSTVENAEPEERVQVAAAWADSHNYVPKVMKQMISSGMFGDDPAAQQTAVEMAGQTVALDPRLAREFTNDGMKAALEANAMLEAGTPMAVAIRDALETVSVSAPMAEGLRDVFRTDKLADGQWDEFSDRLSGEDGTFFDADISPALRANFDQVLEREYVRNGGDIGRAGAAAQAQFLTRHAVTNIGPRRWQADAPERLYGLFGDERDSTWIELQARGWAAGQVGQGLEGMSEVTLTPSPSARVPGYIVTYVDDAGLTQQILSGMFIPDPAQARSDLTALEAAEYQAGVERVKASQDRRREVESNAPRPGTTRDLRLRAREDAQRRSEQ